MAKLFHRTHTDPVTGDSLTTGEWVSWGVQHVLRRWSWLILTQVVTAICWIWGIYNPNVLVWWNLNASDYAVVVESLTAMVLILQQMRDAVVIRKLLAMSQRLETQLAKLEEHDARLERIEEQNRIQLIQMSKVLKLLVHTPPGNEGDK